VNNQGLSAFVRQNKMGYLDFKLGIRQAKRPSKQEHSNNVLTLKKQKIN
jgi:hypothetical protein